jgi:WD40 repeat protein
MARFRGGQGRALASAALLVFGFLRPPAEAADSVYYNRPVLTVDPGMHTGSIKAMSTDAAGQFGVTGSVDKTVRIWSLSEGKLLRTIWMPSGPGSIGEIFAVAMTLDGNIVAAGGFTGNFQHSPIYLFHRETGKTIGSILGLGQVVFRLAFSPDGRYLAATLGGEEGLHVFDRDRNWSEIFRDTEYGDSTHGAAFATDGRLATASDDGRIRLYDRNFQLVTSPVSAPTGRLPRGVAFSPDGSELAVGYYDVAAVDLFDGRNLSRLLGPDLAGLERGSLEDVAWSLDGQMLYAGGRYPGNSWNKLIFSWEKWGGPGTRLSGPACGDDADSVMGLAPLPERKLFVAAANPCLTLLDADRHTAWINRSPKADFRNQRNSLAVSTDGAIVDFGFEEGGKSPLRFEVSQMRLAAHPGSDGATRPPRQDGIAVTHWANSSSPKLDGRPIALMPRDASRSLTIDPQARFFVLGTAWSLRNFDSEGKSLWGRAVPGEAWAVNISGDGRLVAAAYGDGTIRWHHPDDGRELLALRVLPDKKNWVLWTPEGFYAATPNAHGVLRWLVNRGPDKPAETFPVSVIPRLHRPDALKLVLQERETARALGIADLAAARIDVQNVTGAAEAPGARLHVLTIGISNYGDKAEALRLNFADKDAEDVANALINTQGGKSNKLGGLYAEVVPQYLPNDQATKEGIFTAIEAMQRRMATSPSGEDLAVVMFSGHGAMIDGRFYLLPYAVNARSAAAIKATAISADDFQLEIKKLANHGRVLVLLDACHSAAVASDGTNFAPNADRLRAAMASGNVSVLTSSSATEFSREDEDWQHGAFTKVLIEALGKAADENNDGMISMSELTAYLSIRLPALTEQQQHPGIEQRFQNNLFVAGL